MAFRLIHSLLRGSYFNKQYYKQGQLLKFISEYATVIFAYAAENNDNSDNP